MANHNNISRIVKLNKNYLYIPKEFLRKMGIYPNDKIILRCSDNGILIHKVSVLQELEDAFNEWDEELRNTFIMKKSKELKR